MQAAVRDRWGGLDVVEMDEIERPTPIADQVLIRVVAASVNRADLDLLGPDPMFVRLFMGLRVPNDRGVGCDVAGIVEAVGPDVTRFTVGDRVFGDMYPFGLGSFAEYKCAPERAFLEIPDEMSFEDASTLPHAAILAVQGLRGRDGRTIEPGGRVLIDGASGNVGPFAVHIAKSLGADVTGTCRADKMEFVRSLGADHVLDYASTDYVTTGERYDWILDVHSHHTVFQARNALRRGGTYVTLGGRMSRILQSMTVGPVASLATSHRMGLMLWWKPFDAADVATLSRLHAEGTLKPSIDRTFPLAEAVAALRYVDEGHPRGKVVIVP